MIAAAALGTPVVRCSCGEHDLKGDGPYEECHFCGHKTNSRPIVDWRLGRLWYPICHRCAVTRDFDESLYVVLALAPEDLIARAYMFEAPREVRVA